MKQIVLILLLTGFLASCSMQSKLSRQFNGEPIEQVKESFKSIPVTEIPQRNGNTKVIFTKEAKLPGTVINQGEKSLDPITTPPVTKIEQFIFEVDKNGIVINSEYSNTYKKL